MTTEIKSSRNGFQNRMERTQQRIGKLENKWRIFSQSEERKKRLKKKKGTESQGLRYNNKGSNTSQKKRRNGLQSYSQK